MELHPKEAFISAIGTTRKPVAFLVGSPLSTGIGGKGVPGISTILDIVREVVLEETPSGAVRFDAEIKGKEGAFAYQSAMGWLQANVHQDAVNMVIRRAVLKSCLDVSTVGDALEPTSDGKPEHWHLPAGTRSLAALSCCADPRYHGPILTPNFDPLLSLAVRDAGGRPNLRILDTDGSLPRDVEDDPDTRDIIHLHGYWRGSDTLHTATQLCSPRLKLKASLQRFLRNHLLVVVAYGGWDDVFTTALAELLHDDQAQLDVLWCFRETNSAIVNEQYKHLLESVTPAITRGRFRGYGGIDCHTIFSEVTAAANTPLQVLIPNPVTLSEDKSAGSVAFLSTTVLKNDNNNFIDRYLTNRLEEALESFSSQPRVWVDPIIAKRDEVAKDDDPAAMVELSDLISSPKSLVIKAPPQFGLTCLAHYLAREAWRSHKACLWLYLDSKSLKPNAASIQKAVETELKLLGCEFKDIKCVIIDSWTNQEKESQTLLQQLCIYFKDVRIVVMKTLEYNHFVVQSNGASLDREFEELFLWALPRGHVRKVVVGYNQTKHIGDEDKVTSKLVSDLEVLNIHRTPFNCLTLLKVSEIDFDESPVNRCEMIKRVLFLLFNVDEIPTYKIRPDLKDSEYVLGYFCEKMIRDSNYYFTRDFFLSELKACCKERIIDLEVQVVFDVLSINHIIIKRGDMFGFRFTYWIYYFAAQRMHHDPTFANFIFENKRYANYPEIIEFYTGIDRRREDALRVLIDDIRATSERVQQKCGLPDGLNPYKFAQWRPSVAALSHMKNEIADGVKSSNLPASIKDEFADRLYDRSRPYDQDIRNILTESSFEYMVQTMRAGARALRNSDYVNPEIKRQLLREIVNCWEQVSKVLITLLPLLIKRGRAAFDGYGFSLVGDFGDTPEIRLQNILNDMPTNIVNWYQEDLFSQKMGPLLIDRLNNEKNDILKHELVLLLIHQRPRGWKLEIQQYITAIKKDSFYLWDVYRTLRGQYRFSFASPQNLTDMKYLIKMSIAKHETGSKMPALKVINGPRFKNAIPVREVDQEV